MVSRSLTLIAPVAALMFTVGSAGAQSAPLQQYAPDCHHIDYRGNFRLNGAKQHLDLARSTTYADVRKTQIGQAQTLLEASAHAGGVDQASLWYVYGDLYAIEGDLAGADSAFTKVEASADADCKRSIGRERHNLWVPLQNAGVGQMNNGNGDSALALFRTANRIYRTEPYAYLNMASIFYGKRAFDSAIAYFRLAAHSTQDHRFDEDRATALFNAARLIQGTVADTASVRAEAQRRGVTDSAVRQARLTDAEAAYREVLAMRPRDLAAQASLAGVLSGLHREAEAQTVYDSMLAHADSMDAMDLMDAGTALFRTGRYQLAARATEMGLAKNRCYRDGLYNLANIYLAAKDSVKLLEVSRRLVAEDSMNKASLQVLARAWQDNGNKDSTLHVLERAEALPWELSVLRFDPTDTSVVFHGMVTNDQAQQVKGFNLTVQFVDGACSVVTSQSVDIPDLAPNGNAGQSYDFNMTANGRGIVAWKYKTN